jgi:hypothetical protein
MCVEQSNCLKTTGIISIAFRTQQTLNKTRIKLRNIRACPAVLCVTENWTVKARDVTRITAAEVKYMRKKQQDTLGQIVKQTQRLQWIQI